jgi:hypothetical protein
MSTRNLWGRVEVRGGRGREGQTCLADWDRSEQLGPEGTEHERREREEEESHTPCVRAVEMLSISSSISREVARVMLMLWRCTGQQLRGKGKGGTDRL